MGARMYAMTALLLLAAAGSSPGAAADPAAQPAVEEGGVEAGAVAQTAPSEPPRGEIYINDRFGYALRRPRDWSFHFEPGLDVVIQPRRGTAEIQVVARSYLDVRFVQVPEGPLTLETRAAARESGEAFDSLRRCVPRSVRDFLQLFWLESYAAWHTSATAEEYAEFKLESRREVRLGTHAGVELVYTLLGRRRPGTQKIKTIIVAYEERICQLSYIARQDRYDDDLKAFHAVVNSLYVHRDRG